MSRRGTNYANNVVRGGAITLEYKIYFPPRSTGIFSATMTRNFNEANSQGGSVLSLVDMLVTSLGYNYPYSSNSGFQFTALSQTTTGTLDVGFLVSTEHINNIGMKGYNGNSDAVTETNDNLVLF